MTEINLTVYGKPEAQKRAKFFRHKNFVQVTDPSAKDKKDFAYAAWEQKPDDLIVSEIEMTVRFYFNRPKGDFGTGRNSAKLKPSAPIHHKMKPDLDNLVKFVKDSLNKVYWKDDSQVYFITASKHYTLDEPRTEISIKYK